MLAFVGPVDGKEVHHKDNDRTNNHLDNLEWVTHHENIQHGFLTGEMKRHGEHNPRSFLTEADVLEIRRLFASGVSREDLAEKFNLRYGHVADICSGRLWKHLLEAA